MSNLKVISKTPLRTLMRLTIDVKVPISWTEDQTRVALVYNAFKFEQIVNYAKSISWEYDKDTVIDHTTRILP